MKKNIIDRYIVDPIEHFIHKQTSTGIVLLFATILALVVANSPLAENYHALWKETFTIGFENFRLKKDMSHWINDGLMAVFFFVVGLELKREIIAGELARPKEAMLPIFAAIGGMVAPALIFIMLNDGSLTEKGWGIPMATDIAFALGILYILGDRVPFGLKVFLTALAIVDDLGAVLVVAIFYTSEISMVNLGIGVLIMGIMLTANYMGVRNTTFYAIFGIGGLWLAFLLSGVHATIAAVLAAFTIPADMKIDTSLFARKTRLLLHKITRKITTNPGGRHRILNKHELEALSKLQHLTKDAHTPLQRLEHALHPLVGFVILPIFAFSNAGVTVSDNFFADLMSPLALGIIMGLMFGKLIGIALLSKLVVFLKLSSLPRNVTWRHIYGVALLAGVGFTMSLFITDLAFLDEQVVNQAKIGVLTASTLSGILGYLILYKSPVKQEKPEKLDEEEVVPVA
ncbi:MAG: Na+/H+ antiporter NhaA [Cytophagaceae bacterium]